MVKIQGTFYAIGTKDAIVSSSTGVSPIEFKPNSLVPLKYDPRSDQTASVSLSDLITTKINFTFVMTPKEQAAFEQIARMHKLYLYIRQRRWRVVFKRKGEPFRVIKSVAGRPLNHGTH